MLMTLSDNQGKGDNFMLIDTDVLIWLARDNANAKKMLLNNDIKYISIITYMEVLQGVRNKAELNAFLKQIKTDNYHILPLNEEIGNYAGELMKNYYLSHSMQMFDALIASTAIFYHKPLLSANAKHYAFIEHLQLMKFVV